MGTTPCIPFDPEGRHCLAALLLGARCCPDGRCALCARDRARMRLVGFSEDEITRRDARRRRRRLARCPACGFPPPPPLLEIPAFPRLERRDRTLGGSWTCRACGKSLPKRRRTYCSDECWREQVRRNEMATDDVIRPAPPRVFRAPAAWRT